MFKDFEKEIQINKEYLIDFVFINPNTMKNSNFNLGDTLVIKMISNKNLISQFSSVCWPSNQISLFNLGINKKIMSLNGIFECQTVMVQKYEDRKKLQAVEIDVEYVSNLSSTSIFDLESTFSEDSNLILAFLKEIYLNKTIIAGQHLTITYMGQNLVFKAIYIDGLTTQEKANTINLMNKIENSLKLTESGLPDYLPETILWDSIKEFQHLIETDLNLYTISQKTKFNLINSFDLKEINFDAPIEKGKKNSLNDIGGLDKEIDILKDYFINQFNLDNLYKQIGKIFILNE